MKLRLQLLSDLHFEFHRDRGQAFVEALDPEGVDILVIAGDLSPAKLLEPSLKMLCDKYPHVVYVSGNHEAYGASPEKVAEIKVRVSGSTIPNLHWLERETWNHKGVRFVGTTLWFPDSVAARMQKHGWSDFTHIKGLYPWVFEENEKSVAFLAENMKADDIVVTHYLPSYKSVGANWIGANTNCYFVCDLESLIVEKQPKLFCHGHTHEACNYHIDRTLVLCNPHGYIRYESQDKFNNHLTVEI